MMPDAQSIYLVPDYRHEVLHLSCAHCGLDFWNNNHAFADSINLGILLDTVVAQHISECQEEAGA